MNSLRMSFWIVPASFPARRPVPQLPRCKARGSAARRRSSSWRRTSCPAECRRRAYACRKWSRWPRRPCPHRPTRGRGRSRSRGAWPGRTRPTGLSGRRPGCGGRKRWSLPPSRSPHTDEPSRAGSCTWSGKGHGQTGRGPDNRPGSPARRGRPRYRRFLLRRLPVFPRLRRFSGRRPSRAACRDPVL